MQDRPRLRYLPRSGARTMAWRGDVVALYRGVLRELDKAQSLGAAVIAPGFLAGFDRPFGDAHAMMSVWLEYGDGHMRQFVRLYKTPATVIDLMVPKTEIRLSEELEDLASTVSTLLAAGDVDGYFVAGQAWVARKSRDEAVDVIVPSQRSQREEVMAIGVGLRDRGYQTRLYPVKRPWNGDRPSLGRGQIRDVSPLRHPLYANLFDNEPR
jgi:hypothetical protein